MRHRSFFRVRRGTFPYYGVEDDAASPISLISTTHSTNTTCVTLTIIVITHLSFSERIAIANLSYTLNDV